jgi:hypothetical protein
VKAAPGSAAEGAKGNFAMTGIEKHADSVKRANPETMFRFVVTLIVSTLMVAATAYVLSYAILAPERLGSAHSPAPPMQRVRT